MTPANPPESKNGESFETNGGGADHTTESGSGAAPNVAVGQEKGDSEAWRSPMPPKIDEGDEPPHPNVLPA